MSALPAPSAPRSGPSATVRPAPLTSSHGQHEQAPSHSPAAALRQLEARLGAV
ncbi:MAG: hypothetical protein JWN17_2438, partial [Frankiales bacterium]|nr:hypothetical protein [Frankiales bacterium]